MYQKFRGPLVGTDRGGRKRKGERCLSFSSSSPNTPKLGEERERKKGIWYVPQHYLCARSLRPFVSTSTPSSSSNRPSLPPRSPFPSEERGSVYSVGSNNSGQLGLGDLIPRSTFTVLPSTRGMGVRHVAAGYNLSFACTEDHDVYVWGGAGSGPMGLAASASSTDNSGFLKYVNPQPSK